MNGREPGEYDLHPGIVQWDVDVQGLLLGAIGRSFLKHVPFVSPQPARVRCVHSREPRRELQGPV